ncbi:hypothetical protein D3C84_1264920 [compost metagenome]
MTVQGSEITLFINEEEVIKHTDNTFEYGMFGVSTIAAARTSYSNMRFSEI